VTTEPAEKPAGRTYKTKHGTTAQMDTEGVAESNKKRAKPKAEEPEEPLDDEGADQGDIVEALMAENAQLKEENATLHIAVGTEKFKTVESLRHYVSVVETQNRELTDQNARLKREVKALRRRLGE
jgi:alcohol dehydrogenase class IV